MLATGVLLVGHQDFITGLEVEAVGDIAVGFGGVANQGDLVAMASDEFGERVAELVPGSVSPNGIVFGILLIHLLCGVVAVEYGAENRCGAGADSTVVEIDFVLGDEELFAQFGPVGVFVLIK
jgi:hypothetical protein